MDEYTAYREIISRLSSTDSPEDIQKIKQAVCRRYRLAVFPKNSAILACAEPHEREQLRNILVVKPTRTLSGVAPVAVMTSPHPCPHGICLPCPGGPDHPFASPQSYTGEEPAALRGREHGYDPYAQVQARLFQFYELGHHVDKAELIVMGGTITARDPAYQEWVVTSSLCAMNDFPDQGKKDCSFLEAAAANESSRVRCIGITFETRPDWCRREHIERMLSLGVTKVELGIQHLNDSILDYNRRGHSVADTIAANCLARDAGLKIGFHMMPNLPGSDRKTDEEVFRTLFSDPSFQPDFLKIYPTLVTPGSEIEDLYNRGEYRPYTEEELISQVAYAKAQLPEYTRLQRVQREFPARLIVAGSRHGNFRQLAQAHLESLGRRCRCIRCREIGRSPDPGEGEIRVVSYDACGGTEFFIQAEAGDSLIGFVRLRFPGSVFSPELDGAALIRELHVYGQIVPLEQEPHGAEMQHRSYGRMLLRRAEEIASEAGYDRIAVMSGIGVRPYYRKQGYLRAGPYMVKQLS
ncbi:MAG: tRNA uridine(34) 5-carboxymethylaminomethyl modification radical SAM/GNAT enzyme Elp3 [Methanocalculus sp. MSAO_Arc1]|uniref:tRNA uridine(34) 5-carboxymethylaminomethyl modification radical SAM/GNAT enzyme Elp3 n=1 Tax=Methanocalculus TaxID=71151 RepID=UPI000FF52E3F|nr:MULTISPECIES: tRNA uridine(34) 5-carboxymethylaminomethyl modification radical SAM/GNAT enzyme Elp3 [unclassified Methanocalculus]MCP1662419.1 elongator complex protein 3 [Methanocalculus sp. AMF5]RQD79483.1 MAG: tRNA uridine(34) 5-carboxymethylaminomethyl modification radical SAM/GNAT enzyme Elp3 [Methanocalculus sp. MSAO_Arc1]